MNQQFPIRGRPTRDVPTLITACCLLALSTPCIAASDASTPWIAPSPSYMTRAGVACFYESAHHRGNFQCQPPGPQSSILPDKLDQAISSMWIPPNMRVWVFDEQWGDGNAAVFAGNVDIDTLRAHDMQDRIRSLQVAWTQPACVENCRIASGEAYDLPGLFGETWTNQLPKHVLLAFDLAAGRVFRIGYGDNVQLVFGERYASLISGEPRSILSHLRYLPTTRYVAVALSLIADQTLEVQLVEADDRRRYLRASPIVSLPWPKRFAQFLSIQVPDVAANRVAPLLANAIFRAEDREPSLPVRRARRGIACDSAPELIDVINVFLGLCGRPSHPELIPAKPSGDPQPGPADDIPQARLAWVAGAGRNPMAMMAAAHACRIPLEYVAAPRMKRDTVPSLACMSRATVIVTLYPLLFPREWNLAHFTRVIDTVLGQGNLGEPVENTRVAATFISAVRQQTGQHDTRRTDALNAFHRANAALATLGTWSPLPSPSSLPAACSHSSAASREALVARARTAAVGRYELDLATYTPSTVVPRVRHRGTWIDSANTFTHTIVDTDDLVALREIIDTTERWHSRYQAHEQTLPRRGPATDCVAQQRRKLVFTAASIAYNIHGDAHGGTGDGTLFVLVRHADAIVAILQAQRRDHAMHITGSLSAPDSVITPETEGSIRGASAYALQQLLAYSKARGFQTVTSEAVTERSALLKVHAGFRYQDEL